MDRIRLAYFTSFREILVDEKVSSVVVDPDTGQNYGYRTGNLEHMALMLAKPQDGHHPLAEEFAQAFELAMVFADDNNQFLDLARNIVHRWPLDATVPANDHQSASLEGLLVNVPSQQWRQIKNPDQKKIDKDKYEAQVLGHLIRNRVDLVVSDSYLTLFDRILLHSYWETILNLHPAFTEIGNPNRLPGVTPTRDAYTKAKYGWIIIDDKKDKKTWPEGKPVDVEFEGRTRKAIPVPISYTTGVTVHVVDENIDAGPVVMAVDHTFTSDASYEKIRQGNYERKLKLLPEALLDYAKRPEVRSAIEFQRIRLLQRRV